MQRQEVQCVLEGNRQNNVCSLSHLSDGQEFLISESIMSDTLQKLFYFGFYPLP
jgi:hypothetical protein